MNATTSKFLSLPPSLPWLYNDQLDNFAAGDIDGDGRQEILVTNCPGSLGGGLAADTIGVAPAIGLLSYFLYRDLEPQNWANEQAAHMLTMWTAQGIVLGRDSSANWILNFTDTFRLADVDGDGVDEVVAMSFEGYSLGVFKWNGTTLESVCKPLVPNFAGPCQLFCADLDGSGDEKIIVFNPNSVTFSVFKWNGSGLDNIFSGQSLDGFLLVASDRLFFPALNGGNGNPKKQVFVYRNTEAQRFYMLFEWDGSTFQQIPHAVGTGFAFAADDQFLVGDVNGDGGDEFLVYSVSQDEQLALISWNGSSFDTEWTTNEVVDGGTGEFDLTGPTKMLFCAAAAGGDRLLLYNQKFPNFSAPDPDTICAFSWQSEQETFLFDGSHTGLLGASSPSPNSHFLCADVDGDGNQEIIVYQAAEASAGTSSTLTVWELIDQKFMKIWSASNCVPAWNLSVIVAGPHTPFTPFQGTQLAIYQYVSNQLDAGDEDIRHKYINKNDEFSFGGWATQVQEYLQMNPPPNNFDLNDWQAVNQQLYLELSAVPKVWGLTDNRNSAANAVMGQQTNDLTTVEGNLSPVPSADANANYWPEQIGVAAIWGLAAVPFVGEAGESYFFVNMMMSMVASLLGSYFSEPQGPSSTTSYSNLSNTVYDLYTNAINASDGDEKTVHKDAVMLPMVGALADGPWAFDSTDSNQVTPNASNSNRLYFYEVLLPLTYNIMYWQSVETQVPAIYKTNDKGGGYWDPICAPGNSYLTESAGDGLYNIYMLYNGGGIFSYQNFTYPPLTLTDDLFGQFKFELGLDKHQFFTGQGVWNTIPQFNFAG